VTLHYDLYWSFRSPYSYLATSRLLALERTYDVHCHVRPVYPLAVRTPEFFEGRDPLWFSYLMMDIAREAAFVGLPLRWPRPDPVYMDRATRTYPADQPHIHRLTHMGVAAAELGRGLPFLAEVSHLIWSGEVDDWHQGDHLRRAAERADLDADALMTAVDDESDRPAGRRSLRRADYGVRRRALLRPGSHRPAQMAYGSGGTDAAPRRGRRSETSTAAGLAGWHRRDFERFRCAPSGRHSGRFRRALSASDAGYAHPAMALTETGRLGRQWTNTPRF
jgi:2-hydroxychromene-2-carboxylate isomerase